MVSKKIICCLIMLMLCLLTSPAYASRLEVLKSPNVRDDKVSTLGTVFMEITAGALNNGDSVTIGLPSGFKFCNTLKSITPQTDWSPTVVENTYRWGNDYNYIEVLEKYNGHNNGLYFADSLQVTPLNENEIKLEIQGSPKPGDNCYLFLHLDAVYIDSGYRGDINLSFNTPSGSGFDFLTRSSSSIANNVSKKSEVSKQETTVEGQVTAKSETQGEKQQSETIVKLVPGSTIAEINGKPYKLDAVPYIDARYQRTMVPLRFISDVLDTGSNLQVNNKQIIIMSKDNKKIILTIGTQDVLVDGLKVKTDCAPVMVDNDKIFVPLRFTTEALGGSVDYVPETNQIIIKKII